MLTVIVAVLALADPSLYSDARPPARYQGNTSVTLETYDQAGIDRVCHSLFGKPPSGMKTDACQTGRRVIAPNPCTFPQTESYARMLCHELGHANGWASTHNREDDEIQTAQSEPGGASAGPQARHREDEPAR